MDTFFWSVVLAVLSALTLVAYKHPRGFARNIFPPLMFLLVCFVLGTIAWYLGTMNSLTESISHEIAQAKEASSIPTYLSGSVVRTFTWFKYLLGASVIVAVYLAILRFLPKILDIDEKIEKPHNEEKNG